MTTIFFDLDGTLIDTSKRHYQVYKDLLKNLQIKNLANKKIFWDAKREGKKTIEFLPPNCSEEQIKKFNEGWLQYIEKLDYLDMDITFQDSLHVLSRLSQNFKLILATNRTNADNLMIELKNMALTGYFKEVLINTPLLSKDKAGILNDYLKQNPDNNYFMIGDSEVDIMTGKKLTIPTIAVTYGQRSKAYLKKYSADYYVDSLPEIFTIINGEYE